MRHRLFTTGMILATLLCLSACSSAHTGGAPRRPALTRVPSPTPVATADPLHSHERPIDNLISTMTLDQKIGQMFMVEFLGNEYNSYLDGMIRGVHAGGLIIYNNDARTIAQMQHLTADSQANADFPLLIALDQEGGEVNRLAEFYGYAPSAQTMAASGNPSYAYGEGVRTAKLLQGLGVNVNLAPVVDVGNPNAIEGSRIFADTPQATDTYAGAFLDGTQSQGVAAALKHWPGIGSETGDPHGSLPTIPDSLAELTTTDFAAFKALLPRGPAMIMVTHVMVPAIDPTHPATLSPTLVSGILRGQLGYQGVVITDALHMEGIYDYMRSVGIGDFPRMLDEAAIQAILAGDDILEGAFDPDSAQAMLTAIRAAVQSGRIPLARIEESDRRILRLKWEYSNSIGINRLTAAASVGANEHTITHGATQTAMVFSVFPAALRQDGWYLQA